MTGLAIALAVAAGLAGAVQAAVMGELGGRAGVFPALAFSGVVAVVIGLTLLLVARQSFRGLGDVARQPVWLWTGGALSVLIILAITVASPRRESGSRRRSGSSSPSTSQSEPRSTVSASSATTASSSAGRESLGSYCSAPAPRSRCARAADGTLAT